MRLILVQWDMLELGAVFKSSLYLDVSLFRPSAKRLVFLPDTGTWLNFQKSLVLYDNSTSNITIYSILNPAVGRKPRRNRCQSGDDRISISSHLIWSIWAPLQSFYCTSASSLSTETGCKCKEEPTTVFLCRIPDRLIYRRKCQRLLPRHIFRWNQCEQVTPTVHGAIVPVQLALKASVKLPHAETSIVCCSTAVTLSFTTRSSSSYKYRWKRTHSIWLRLPSLYCV